MDYLRECFDWQADDIAQSFDDLSVWSSRPGQLLLDALDYARDRTILDIGHGTGFPLTVLAERFGPTCTLIGVDTWHAATRHVEAKLAARGIRNVRLLRTDAGAIGLADDSVDVITSNLGINNFAAPEAVIAECARVLRPGGSLFLTSNLEGTFAEFYNAFATAIAEIGSGSASSRLDEHVESRATVPQLRRQFEHAGFTTNRVLESSYEMLYADGSAFFRDYFITMCFLPAWREIVDEHDETDIFARTEQALNDASERHGHLQMTVPLALLQFDQLA